MNVNFFLIATLLYANILKPNLKNTTLLQIKIKFSFIFKYFLSPPLSLSNSSLPPPPFVSPLPLICPETLAPPAALLLLSRPVFSRFSLFSIALLPSPPLLVSSLSVVRHLSAFNETDMNDVSISAVKIATMTIKPPLRRYSVSVGEEDRQARDRRR